MAEAAVRAALAEVDSESISWKATHLRFLAPFFVEDGRKCRFRIQLRGSRAQWQFELQTQVESTEGSSWEPVATARLALDLSIAPEPLNVATIAARRLAEARTDQGSQRGDQTL